MKRIITTGVCIFCLFISLFGTPPKREMRATWVSTVWGLDWPKVKATAANPSGIIQQKKELTNILDSLASANMNAIFFQVRGMSDAMYASSYEPWSQYVSGGRGTSPGYDPLAFAIEESHKRGIELHVWINPYRYATSADNFGKLPTDHSQLHPEWLLDYGLKSDGGHIRILDPGNPEVTRLIKGIIGEIVNNYDIDGIVFDDYFYAYGGTAESIDKYSQDRFKPIDMDLGDWRRRNVNSMIAAVYDTIQQVKPFVTFGVSPFGTWTTRQSVADERGIVLPTGLGSSMDAYSSIYCDPVAWLEEGTVDYISPQLYWQTNSSLPYGILSPWWSELANRFGKHFYSSQQVYESVTTRSSQTSTVIGGEVVPLSGMSTLEMPSFEVPDNIVQTRATVTRPISQEELSAQINHNREGDVNGAPGSVFFRSYYLFAYNGFTNYLNKNDFSRPALPPAISWKAAPQQGMVENLSLNGQSLAWEYAKSDVRYAVYAIPVGSITDNDRFSSSAFLQGISYSKSFLLPDSVSSSSHKIAVSVLDRHGNEFIPKIMGEEISSVASPQLIYPLNNMQGLVLPVQFQWEEVPEADLYILQVAENQGFAEVLVSRETSEVRFSSSNISSLKPGVTYYWRVIARKANASDSHSEVRSFVGSDFKIISPQNGSEDVSLTPTFEWNNIGPGTTYKLELSTDALFTSSKIVYVYDTDLLSHTVPAEHLINTTTYFARVTAENEFTKVYSPVISFTTLQELIPVPVIVYPLDGSDIEGDKIELIWDKQKSKGFRLELSESASFPVRSTLVKSTDAFTYRFDFTTKFGGTPLTSGTYYMRVLAINETGYTSPSNVVKINFTAKSSSLTNQSSSEPACYFYIKDGQGYIYYESREQTKVLVNIYTVSGIFLDRNEVEIKSGGNTIILDKYPHGSYLIEVKAPENRKVLRANY